VRIFKEFCGWHQHCKTSRGTFDAARKAMAIFTYRIANPTTRECSTIAWDRQLGQVWGPMAHSIRAKAKECEAVVLSFAPGTIDSTAPHLKSDHGLLCLLQELGWEFAPQDGDR
jgi:hypothetical protein